MLSTDIVFFSFTFHLVFSLVIFVLKVFCKIFLMLSQLILKVLQAVFAPSIYCAVLLVIRLAWIDPNSGTET